MYKRQKILEGIDVVELRVMPLSGKSYENGPWLEDWGKDGATTEQLPLAMEITLTLVNSELELSRLFTLTSGK